MADVEARHRPHPALLVGAHRGDRGRATRATIRRFVAAVDSAAVLVNASTRFTDGGEFGFGAEIGISTQKLHARGPMGLPEMTSTKYVVVGDGPRPLTRCRPEAAYRRGRGGPGAAGR